MDRHHEELPHIHTHTCLQLVYSGEVVQMPMLSRLASPFPLHQYQYTQALTHLPSHSSTRCTQQGVLSSHRSSLSLSISNSTLSKLTLL